MLFNWFIMDWYKLYLDQTKHPKAERQLSPRLRKGTLQYES